MVVQKFDIHRGPIIHLSVNRRMYCHAVMYICWLTDEYRGLYSSMPITFLSFGIEEYSSVIFFDIEKYKKPEEDIMFFCSVGWTN
jgi:hypothetical protein